MSNSTHTFSGAERRLLMQVLQQEIMALRDQLAITSLSATAKDELSAMKTECEQLYDRITKEAGRQIARP